MLVNFDPQRICLHDGGSTCLVPLICSTVSFGPGDRFIVPWIALEGIESHVTPAIMQIAHHVLHLI